jgi:hypothetical protein
MKGWQILAAVAAVVFVLLPLGLVPLTSGPDEEAYACKVETKSALGSTLGGKLQLLLVHSLDGRAPTNPFVITIDHDYTRAAENPVLPGQVFWAEGTLMDRETYFGEQYLFVGYPQIYLSQVKTGALWPDQKRDPASLYLAPVTSLASIYFVWAFPFLEEFSLGGWLLLVARFLLTCVCLVLGLAWRRRPIRPVGMLGFCLIAAVGLSAAGL